jgi:hypothetical protein
MEINHDFTYVSTLAFSRKWGVGEEGWAML